MSYLVLPENPVPRILMRLSASRPWCVPCAMPLPKPRCPCHDFQRGAGVGKTTLARIMAKALNCGQGEPDVPCNQLSFLRRDQWPAAAMDLHEIDGASNRGIQEIRELKENIRFLPAGPL
jgi:DNA polymerase III subunit gamma/tau